MSRKSKTGEIARAFRKAAPYLNMIYTLFGSILLFGYIGYRLDKKFGQSPLFLIIGVFFGFGLGFYQMMRILKSLENKNG